MSIAETTNENCRMKELGEKEFMAMAIRGTRIGLGLRAVDARKKIKTRNSEQMKSAHYSRIERGVDGVSELMLKKISFGLGVKPNLITDFRDYIRSMMLSVFNTMSKTDNPDIVLLYLYNNWKHNNPNHLNEVGRDSNQRNENCEGEAMGVYAEENKSELSADAEPEMANEKPKGMLLEISVLEEVLSIALKMLKRIKQYQNCQE